MATTALTSRVSTRLPFQTLAGLPSEPDVASSANNHGHTDATVTGINSLEAPDDGVVSPTSAVPHTGVVNITMLLLLAENAVRVLQPLAIGLAVNNLLTRSSQGLIFLVGQHLTSMLLSRLRQMSVARQLNRVVVADVLQATTRNSVASGLHPVTFEASHLRKRQHAIESALPETVHIATSLCGALLLLSWYDWTLVPLCLVLVIPAVLLNTAVGRRSQLLGREFQHTEEHQAEVLSSGDARAIRLHFERVNQLRLRMVDADATSFCLMQMFVLGLLATTLIHFCFNATSLPGDILAVVLYVLMYATALSGKPILIRHITTLRSVAE